MDFENLLNKCNEIILKVVYHYQSSLPPPFKKKKSNEKEEQTNNIFPHIPLIVNNLPTGTKDPQFLLYLQKIFNQ